MKYIMIETMPQNDSEKRFIPIIFPKELVHAEMAKAVGHLLARQGIRSSCVRSAGQVKLTYERGSVTCYGESETCKVKSHESDADIIRLIDYHHSIAESVDMTAEVVDTALRMSGRAAALERSKNPS